MGRGRGPTSFQKFKDDAPGHPDVGLYPDPGPRGPSQTSGELEMHRSAGNGNGFKTSITHAGAGLWLHT